MNPPEGFLAMVSRSIILYFASFPSLYLQHLTLHSTNAYNNPNHLCPVFVCISDHIFDLLRVQKALIIKGK